MKHNSIKLIALALIFVFGVSYQTLAWGHPSQSLRPQTAIDRVAPAGMAPEEPAEDDRVSQSKTSTGARSAQTVSADLRGQMLQLCDAANIATLDDEQIIAIKEKLMGERGISLEKFIESLEDESGKAIRRACLSAFEGLPIFIYPKMGKVESIDIAMLENRFGIRAKMDKRITAQQKQIMEVGYALRILAHGVSNVSIFPVEEDEYYRIPGIERAKFLNILLEKEIFSMNFEEEGSFCGWLTYEIGGRIDIDDAAGAYGDLFVVLTPNTPRSDYSFPVSQHAFYRVPEDVDKRYLEAGLEESVAKKLITADYARSVVGNILTYQEFLDEFARFPEMTFHQITQSRLGKALEINEETAYSIHKRLSDEMNKGRSANDAILINNKESTIKEAMDMLQKKFKIASQPPCIAVIGDGLILEILINDSRTPSAGAAERTKTARLPKKTRGRPGGPPRYATGFGSDEGTSRGEPLSAEVSEGSRVSPSRTSTGFTGVTGVTQILVNRGGARAPQRRTSIQTQTILSGDLKRAASSILRPRPIFDREYAQAMAAEKKMRDELAGRPLHSILAEQVEILSQSILKGKNEQIVVAIKNGKIITRKLLKVGEDTVHAKRRLRKLDLRRYEINFAQFLLLNKYIKDIEDRRIMLLGTERVISEMSGGECRFSPDTNDFGTTQAILCAVLLSQAGNEAIAYEDLIPDKDGGAVYILWNNQLVQYEEFMHKDGNGVTVIKSINGVEISRGKANDFLVPDQDFPILARMGPQKAMELYEELFSGGSKKFIGHVEWGGRIVFAGRPMFLKKTESKTKSKTENETKKVFSLNRSSDGELVHTLIPGKNPIPEYHAEIFISELGVRVYGLKGSENILVDNSLASLRDIAETLKSELEGSVLRPVANMERNGAMQARKTIERLRKLYHDIETDALPDVLAVGDQHGDNNVLAHMLELVKEGRLAENAMIVLKGDEFDRGDNNRENFSCMKELKRLLGGRVVYCLGNHNIILVLTVLFKDLVMELQFYNPWVR